MKVKLKDRRLLFISNFYDYEMCCFKRKMCTPKRLKDSKAWCPLSTLLEILSPYIMAIQDKNKKNNIR